MRILLCTVVAGVVLALGCVGRQTTRPQSGTANVGAPPEVPASNQKLIITPEAVLAGKVIWVNTPGRFVVLNFPIGRLPMVEQRLDVYRRGLKVAEVKVTDRRLDDNVVADVLMGDAAVGDEVRE